MLENLQDLLSGIADKYRTNEIDKRELEHRLMQVIALEIDENKLDRATWLKAFSDAEANDQKAQALYIKYRKERLIDQVIRLEIELKRQSEAAKRAARTSQASANPKPETFIPPMTKEEREVRDKRNRTAAYFLMLFGVVVASFAFFSFIFRTFP